MLHASKIWQRQKNILIVLEEEKDDILKWTSSNLIKIYTKNGY